MPQQDVKKPNILFFMYPAPAQTNRSRRRKFAWNAVRLQVVVCSWSDALPKRMLRLSRQLSRQLGGVAWLPSAISSE